MELQQLAYFVQICDAASISQAATRAHLSQPALSRQLKLLEEELGVDLFTRTARGVVPTEAGMILRERAGRLLKDADALRHDVKSVVSDPRGDLAVGTLTSLLAYLAAPALAAFHDRHPQVSFRVIEGTSLAIRDAVAYGKIDVGFVSMIEDLGAFEVCPLLTEQLFLVGHPDLGLDTRRSAPLALLHQVPLILTARPNSLRVVVDRVLGRLGKDGNVAYEVETLTLAMQLVRLGQGVSVFPFSAIDEFITRKEICAAPLSGMFMSWALAYSKERSLSTAARLFVATVRSQAKMRILSGGWPTAKFIRGDGRAG